MLAKLSRILIITMFLAGLIAIPAAAATTVGISGTVLAYGKYPLLGVTVSIKGTAFSAKTSSTGNYHIGSIPVGTSGTLVATYANYVFTPTGVTIPPMTASLAGENFNGTITNFSKYNIAGVVMFNGAPLPNVAVTLTTSVTQTVYSAVTDATGAYTLTNVSAATTGKIVAKLAGYSFSPSSISILDLSKSLVGENFTALLTISGKVTDQATLLPLSGVVVTCGTLSATSSATGTYTIRNVPVGTSCTLTPSMSGKTFTPATYTIASMTAPVRSQNFIAVP